MAELSKQVPKVRLSAEFIRAVILPIMAPTIEGGEVNNVRDRGRLTKYGISSRYYPQVLSPTFSQWDAFLIMCQIAVDSNTVDIAIAVKRAGSRDYRLALYYMLLAVNAGEDDACSLLQSCMASDGIEVKVDGVYGPKTNAGLEKWLGLRSLEASANIYLGATRGWYSNHASETGQNHFLMGWLNRMGQNLVIALDSGVKEVERDLFPEGLTDIQLA